MRIFYLNAKEGVRTKAQITKEIVDLVKYIGLILNFGSQTVMELFPLILCGISVILGFFVQF